MATTVKTGEQIACEESAPCDGCHKRRGVSFIDGFWACAWCARHYLDYLEGERWRR